MYLIDEKLFKELGKGTTKYTKVYAEREFTNNAPHEYEIVSCNDEVAHLGDISFQNGPIKESGVNGVMGEDLINIVIDRLEHFQASEFKCRQNALAITKLEEALFWLRDRTNRREARGVEGTHTV